MQCSRCHSPSICLHPIASSRLCIKCLNYYHQIIISKIPPEKIKYASYFEIECLIHIHSWALDNGFACNFQHEIYDHDEKCALLRSDKEYKCKYGYEEEHECDRRDYCKFWKSNNFTKYVLDFALIKGNLQIDLELDGARYHDNRKGYDLTRDMFMEEMGWHVVRIPYSSIFHDAIEKISDKISEVLDVEARKAIVSWWKRQECKRSC